MDNFDFTSDQLLKLPQISIANAPLFQVLDRKVQIFSTRAHVATSSRKYTGYRFQGQIVVNALTFWPSPKNQRPSSSVCCLDLDPASSRNVIDTSDLSTDHSSNLAEAVIFT